MIKKKLRLMCRRGNKELDLLTTHYLEHHYEHASIAERNWFQRLLRLDDPNLWDLLHNQPVQNDYGADLIHHLIRQSLKNKHNINKNLT